MNNTQLLLDGVGGESSFTPRDLVLCCLPVAALFASIISLL